MSTVLDVGASNGVASNFRHTAMTDVNDPSPVAESTSVAGVASPQLGDDTKDLVRRSLSSGLCKIDEIKKVVVSLMAQNTELTPPALVDGLVGAGVLSHWQGRKLLSGAARGFHLGNYRLLRPLGRGGMGVVYLGEHHVMKRQMALKILPSAASTDPRRIERFKAEAEACAQLDHENIVRAYDFGRDGSKLYIVMEYVDGVDLAAMVRRDGVMTAAAAIDALTQATAGLAHAHERGIVHRDIKPANLLLRSDGLVKVSDLGLARIGYDVRDDGNRRRMIGTADYLAPEQAIDSRTVDARADIYALGCTLTYLMTGHPPYRDRMVPAVLAKHQTAPVVDLRSLCPDCPPAVADLATRMMAKQPSARPRSAVELLAMLKRLGGRSGASSVLIHGGAASTGDTLIDDMGTLSGSDSGSAMVSSEEIDFANLPAIDLGTSSVSPSARPRSSSSAIANPVGGSAGQPRPGSSINGGKNDARQTLMLGVGLTVAATALIVVLAMGYHLVTHPPDQVAPPIKSYEDKDGNVIVIR